jgi:hypothetical protein
MTNGILNYGKALPRTGTKSRGQAKSSIIESCRLGGPDQAMDVLWWLKRRLHIITFER